MLDFAMLDFVRLPDGVTPNPCGSSCPTRYSCCSIAALKVSEALTHSIAKIVVSMSGTSGVWTCLGVLGVDGLGVGDICEQRRSTGSTSSPGALFPARD